MRFGYVASLVGLAVPGCVLPSVEVDENFSAGGAGGSRPQTGGTAGSGGAGRGGSAGNLAMAGKGGSAGSGSDPREDACINYCTLYLQACVTHEANSYDDINDCIATCAVADWPFDPAGEPEAPNSLQCRRLHAGFAVAANPELHCFHSAELPSMGKCEP